MFDVRFITQAMRLTYGGYPAPALEHMDVTPMKRGAADPLC